MAAPDPNEEQWMRDKWAARVETAILVPGSPPKPRFGADALFRNLFQATVWMALSSSRYVRHMRKSHIIEAGVALLVFSARFGTDTISSDPKQEPVSAKTKKKMFETVLDKILHLLSPFRPLSSRIVLRSVSRAELRRQCDAHGVHDLAQLPDHISRAITNTIFLDDPTGGAKRGPSATRLQAPTQHQPALTTAPTPMPASLVATTPLTNRTAAGLATVPHTLKMDALLTAVLGFLLGAETRGPIRLAFDLVGKLIRTTAAKLRSLGSVRADSRHLGAPAKEALRRWRILVENANMFTTAASILFSQSADEKNAAIRTSALRIPTDPILHLSITRCLQHIGWATMAESAVFEAALNLLGLPSSAPPAALPMPAPAVPTASTAPIASGGGGATGQPRGVDPRQSAAHRATTAPPPPRPQNAAAAAPTLAPNHGFPVANTSTAAASPSFISAALYFLLHNASISKIIENISMFPSDVLRIVEDERHRVLQHLVRLAGRVRSDNFDASAFHVRRFRFPWPKEAAPFEAAFAETEAGRRCGPLPGQQPDAVSIVTAVLDYIHAGLAEPGQANFEKEFSSREERSRRCERGCGTAPRLTLGPSTFHGALLPMRLPPTATADDHRAPITLQAFLNHLDGVERLGDPCGQPTTSGRCQSPTRIAVRTIMGDKYALIVIDRFRSGGNKNTAAITMRTDNIYALRVSAPGSPVLRQPFKAVAVMAHQGRRRSDDGWTAYATGGHGAWWSCAASQPADLGPGPHHFPLAGHGQLCALLLRRTSTKKRKWSDE